MQFMSTELPTYEEFVQSPDALDAKYAWKHFGGLTLDQAAARFEEDPLVYCEDLMFMGWKAFVFYFPVVDQFLRKTAQIDIEEREDRHSWILARAIENQFTGTRAEFVRQLRQPVLQLCNFMLSNLDLFTNDGWDVTQIEQAWQELQQLVAHLE